MKSNNITFGVLDIETSTKYDTNGEPLLVWLAYGVLSFYHVDGTKLKTYHYREWSTLRDILQEVHSIYNDRKTIIYVHNLSFDIDYIYKNISRPKNIISNSTHGIISTKLEDFPNLEFRCSFRLTMNSLAKLGKSIGLEKLDSDYRTILPADDVTQQEWEYCERDCDIVAQYVIRVLLKEFGLLKSIPLTKTGRVRKVFHEFYDQYFKGTKQLWDTLPPTDCYQAMLDAFTGGLVISNPLFTGRVIKDVDSYDIKSSYPFVMLTEKFPYTITRDYNPNPEHLKEKFWIAKIRFNNIRTKFSWGWLSTSKMNDIEPFTAEYYNGKLLNSAYCVRTVTNIDYELICKTYDFTDIEILEFYHMRNYDYLPAPYIETIKKFAIKKNELSKVVKTIDESDEKYLPTMIEYMLSKNDFNSIYGMAVQKLVQSEYYIDEKFQYHEITGEYKQTNKHIKRNFLFGIYITAYARRNLLNAILVNCPHTLLYTDTDSIKFCLTEKFKGTNVRMLKKYRKYQALRNLGIFEHDAHYDKFVFWGAKKYAYTKHGNLYLTVAGLPKVKGNIKYKRDEHGEEKILTDIEEFHPPMIFPKCKLGSKYIYLDHSFDSTDGFDICNYKENKGMQKFIEDNEIVSNGGVALYPVSYSLDITRTDRRILEEWQNDLANLLKVPTFQSMTSHTLNSLIPSINLQ